MRQPLWRMICQCLHKIKMSIKFGPAILLGIYTCEIKKDTCNILTIENLTETLIIISKKSKQLKHSAV